MYNEIEQKQGKRNMPSGRKTKLNAELIAKMTADASKGYTDEIVHTNAGIAKRTFYDWKSRGLKAIEAGRDNIYSQFMHKYARAIQSANKKAIDVLQDQLKHGTETVITEEDEVWEGDKLISKTTRRRVTTNAVDWRLASDWLARRDKVNFSLRQEITGADGEGLQIELNWIDPTHDKNND